MARPIKETPEVFGEDARRLKWYMDHLKPISEERRKEMEEAYGWFKSKTKFPMP